MFINMDIRQINEQLLDVWQIYKGVVECDVWHKLHNANPYRLYGLSDIVRVE